MKAHSFALKWTMHNGLGGVAYQYRDSIDCIQNMTLTHEVKRAQEKEK